MILTNWHPLEICTNGIHLPLIGGNTTVMDERLLSVVEVTFTIPVSIVCNLMVIPDRDPRVGRMG